MSLLGGQRRMRRRPTRSPPSSCAPQRTSITAQKSSRTPPDVQTGSRALASGRWSKLTADKAPLAPTTPVLREMRPPHPKIRCTTDPTCTIRTCGDKGGDEPPVRARQSWWERKDSNLRRHSQRIYSPPPLPLGTLSHVAAGPRTSITKPSVAEASAAKWWLIGSRARPVNPWPAGRAKLPVGRRRGRRNIRPDPERRIP